MARTLYNLRILPKAVRVKEITTLLDQQEKLYPHLEQDKGAWHIRVVKDVLRRHGKYLQKLDTRNGACPGLHKHLGGKYIIDGTLNMEFVSIETGQVFRQKNTGPSRWKPCEARHCVAMRNRRIFCTSLASGGISWRNLHLDGEGIYYI